MHAHTYTYLDLTNGRVCAYDHTDHRSAKKRQTDQDVLSLRLKICGKAWGPSKHFTGDENLFFYWLEKLILNHSFWQTLFNLLGQKMTYVTSLIQRLKSIGAAQIRLFSNWFKKSWSPLHTQGHGFPIFPLFSNQISI